jgi:hypothetical protein
MKRIKVYMLFGIALVVSIAFWPTGRPTVNAQFEPTSAPELPDGIYEGYLPCADCSGIQYKLVLNRDGTYFETLFYAAKSESPIVRNGTFTMESETVVLDKVVSGH